MTDAQIIQIQAARIQVLTTEVQRAAEQRQSDQAALAHAQDRWRSSARRTRDLESHLDAIAAAQQHVTTVARWQLAHVPASLESKLTITLALAELAAMIGVARALPSLEPVPPQKRCSAVSEAKQCVNPVALDKISICAGPHDFSRPKLQVVGGDEHLQTQTQK